MAALRNKHLFYVIGWLLFTNQVMIVEGSISVGLLAQSISRPVQDAWVFVLHFVELLWIVDKMSLKRCGTQVGGRAL